MWMKPNAAKPLKAQRVARPGATAPRTAVGTKMTAVEAAIAAKRKLHK
jgi:hypothetical protein